MKLSPERRNALTAKARSFAANLEHGLPYLEQRGISREVAEMFQLGYVPTGQEFGGRISIPYLTPSGVVQMKYRATEQEQPKYLWEAGLGIHLFNAQILITSGDTVVLTEGEMDAICVQAYVGYPAVAYPGVDTWKKYPHWPLCFEGVSEVIVLADGDDVGREAARKIAESIGSRARVIDLPNGLDSNSFVIEKGASALAERISS